MADKKTPQDDADFALFRQEMRDTTPIEHDRRPQQKKKPQARKRPQPAPHSPFTGETFSDMFVLDNVGNEEYLEYRGPGIQHKLFNKLKSGTVYLQAELDLHGLTLDKAEPTLTSFLSYCQQQGLRCVRIIHGKGWGSRDNKPVLKSHVNYWLRQSTIVLAFCSATIEDGGTGALYVLLKRQFSGSETIPT